jgi:hypothetical protein
MKWPSINDTICAELKDGKAFGDFYQPIENEQELTKITALEPRKILTQLCALPGVWTFKCRFALLVSEGNPARPAYMTNLDQNLFEPLLQKVGTSFVICDSEELGSLQLRLQRNI